MAKAGDSIESPPIGDRIVFLKTARDTNGELLQFDDYLNVGGNGPVEHIHTRQEERLEVVSGIMRAKVDGKEQDFKPGECAIIPAGVAHQWWNGGSEELHIRATFVPALKMERFLETFFGLARDGKTDSKGGKVRHGDGAGSSQYRISISQIDPEKACNFKLSSRALIRAVPRKKRASKTG